MVISRFLAILTYSFFIAYPVGATTFFEEEFTCPIGGEKFSATVIGSTSSWGQRPDGKSIGGVDPWPVIECPQNGLPLFKNEFNKVELEQLETLIQSEEFLRMREQDTLYKRIWWLRSKMGATPFSLAVNLLLASWEPDPFSELRPRYQMEFGEAVESLQRTEENADDWFWLTMRAANAYRETAHFSKASRVLELINKPELLPSDKEQADAARRTIRDLAALIAEENSYFEPTNMMEPMIAAHRCIEPDALLSASEIAACNTPEYQEEISILQNEEPSEFEESEEQAAIADAKANLEAVDDVLESLTHVKTGGPDE